MHPLATTRLEQPDAAALTEANVQAATRLGAPFKVYAGVVSPSGLRWRSGLPRDRRRGS
jgi:hypothetical protein